MGITGKDVRRSSQEDAFEKEEQRAPRQPDQGGQIERFSWSKMGRVGSYSISRSPISEVLQKTAEALESVFSDHKLKNYELRLIPMDMKDYPSLLCSIILVSLVDKNLAERVVSTHVLILEGSIQPFENKNEVIYGRNVETIVPTSEVAKTNLLKVADEEVSRQFPGHHRLWAEMEVVPRTFDIEDKSLVYSLAANSLLAVENSIFSKQGRAELNLAYAEKDSTLSAKLSIRGNDAQLINSVGLPIRSDIEISIQSQSVAENNHSAINNQMLQRQSEIGYVTGFIDCVWSPAVPTQQYGGYGVVQPSGQIQDGSSVTSKIQPIFVITESRLRDVSSLTSQIFSIIPSMLLRTNHNWMRAFQPQPGQDSLRNVGALNLEVNLPLSGQQPDPSGRGSIIDVNTANFSMENFYQFMIATFRAHLGIGLDIEECGPSTWTNNIFLAAASGVTEAMEEIFEATDFLTNGRFSHHFGRGRPIVEYFTPIYNGWYLDPETRKKRDIRDFDLITLLNHPMGEDRAVVDTYINSYMDSQLPEKIKLFERMRILQAAFSEVHVTGISHRVLFNMEYLNALVQAASECGLVMNMQNQMHDHHGAGRTAASFNSELFAGGTDMTNRIFSAGTQNYGSMSGRRNVFTGTRW